MTKKAFCTLESHHGSNYFVFLHYHWSGKWWKQEIFVMFFLLQALWPKVQSVLCDF